MSWLGLGLGLGLWLGSGSCSKCPARAETRAAAGRGVRLMIRKHPWPSAKGSRGAANVPRAPWRCRPAHRHPSRRTRGRRACRGGRASSAPAVLAPWRAAAPPPRPRTPRESGRPAPTLKTGPIWPASAAQAAGMAEAGRSSGQPGSSLRRASWPRSEPPCVPHRPVRRAG